MNEIKEERRDIVVAAAAATSGTSRTKINDTKAGMENIDKDRINAIILKHSKSED